jgi:hypothetical protein
MIKYKDIVKAVGIKKKFYIGPHREILSEDYGMRQLYTHGSLMYSGPWEWKEWKKENIDKFYKKSKK